MQEGSTIQAQEAVRLLRSVAEQLKLPLTTIARQAELGQLTGDMQLVDAASIRTHARAALTLVDSYLLGLQLMQDQKSLALEPVSISSTFVDIAHELEGFAKQHDASLRLHIAGKYEPVMANRVGFKSAMLALGYALLEGYPSEGGRLTLAVHRTSHGIVAGLYGQYEQLSTERWRKALELQGRVVQPMSALSIGSGAGLFVAEAILRAMETKLRVGRYLRQQGLAATLQPSQQLQFV